jgi:hypothetical protein
MTTVARTPRIAGDRARRIRGPLGVAAGIGLATLALQVRDPHRHASWGLCPFKALTGWDCPLCGGLRAVNDLGDARILDAAHSNLLFVSSVPVLVGLWVWWIAQRWSGGAVRVRPGVVRPLLTAYAVLAVAFTVVRNTPWGAGLHAT